MDDWTGVSIVPFTSRRVLQAFDVRIPAHFVCHLNMAGCTDVGNESIYRLKPLIHLRTLDLTRTRVSDAGVATIARIGMRRLRHLSVAETEVTDISLKYIAELARDGCLEGVDLTATRVDMVVATAYLTKTQGFVRNRLDPTCDCQGPDEPVPGCFGDASL
ncbi:hypothetical protein BX666DRAFT_1881391 [Dichotomocladium elegans]|nr:hypothetical protein BX666DRAFT_1881391 [Dichotomocladium elegans]